MKARLRILAWSHIVIGGLGLAAFVVLTYTAAQDPEYTNEYAMLGGLLGGLCLVYFLPMFAGGVGLLKGWPQARAVLWIEAAVLALFVPVGTALAGFSLWALVTTVDLSGDGGMARIEQIVRRSLHTIVLALAALFTLGVILLLGWLFRDVIDPPQQQELTPLPSFPPPTVDRPEFTMPELPRAPEQ